MSGKAFPQQNSLPADFCSDGWGGQLAGAGDAYIHLIEVASAILIEGARRRSDVFPGLYEHLQDNVVVTIGGTTRKINGSFQCDSWLHDGRRVDEVFLNADRRNTGRSIGPAEDLLVTLLHELSHVCNRVRGVRDCSSNGNRYHNRRFAEVAGEFGLVIERHPILGHVTPDLRESARTEFADLLSDLDDALVVAREPVLVERAGKRGSTATAAASTTAQGAVATGDTRYVFAACGCETSRGERVSFRMARGSWRADVPIWCSGCGRPFEARVSTVAGQDTEVAP